MSWQQPRFTKKTSHRPIGPSIESVDQIISSGNNNIISNKNKDEKLNFCPRCGGMLLPILETFRCNSCGYILNASESDIEKIESEIVRNKLINELEDLDYEILKRVFYSFFNYYDFFSDDMISRLAELDYSSVVSRINKEHIAYISQRLSKYDKKVEQIFFNKFDIPKGYGRNEKIEYMVENYDFSYIENSFKNSKSEAEYYRKQYERINRYDYKLKEERTAKKSNSKNNNFLKTNLRREEFINSELKTLDDEVLNKLFEQYCITTDKQSKEWKFNYLVKNYDFKEIRRDIKKIKKSL